MNFHLRVLFEDVVAAAAAAEVALARRASGAVWCPGDGVVEVGARVRLDGQVMHVITQDGVLWRSLPCPIAPGQRHKLQGVRLAGPDPLPQSVLTIQRKVSSRGGIQVARQRVQVGFSHAGQSVTIALGDSTMRVIDQHGELITTIPRATNGEITRFKAYGTSQRQ